MTHKNGRLSIFLLFCLFVLLIAAPCAAQETPAWEIFGGFSLEKAEVREYYKSSAILYAIRNQSVTLSGWDVSVTENLNRWFGGTFDLSGYYKTPQLLGTNNQERIYSILYGPRFSYRTRWFNPFAHVLIGAVHAHVEVTPVGPSASEYSFAMAAGGGLDISLGRKAAARLFKAEYFRTDVLGTKQNSFRVSAGVVFYLGKRT